MAPFRVELHKMYVDHVSSFPSGLCLPALSHPTLLDSLHSYVDIVVIISNDFRSCSMRLVPQFKNICMDTHAYGKRPFR